MLKNIVFPEVDIEIEGVSYAMTATMGALKNIYKKTGKDIIELASKPEDYLDDDVVTILYEGLRANGHDFDVDEIEMLVYGLADGYYSTIKYRLAAGALMLSVFVKGGERHDLRKKFAEEMKSRTELVDRLSRGQTTAPPVSAS